MLGIKATAGPRHEYWGPSRGRGPQVKNRWAITRVIEFTENTIFLNGYFVVIDSSLKYVVTTLLDMRKRCNVFSGQCFQRKPTTRSRKSNIHQNYIFACKFTIK